MIFLILIFVLLLFTFLIRYYYYKSFEHYDKISSTKTTTTNKENRIEIIPYEKNLQENTCIIYLHGGGFFTGKAETSSPLLQQYSEECQLPVYLLKYPLNTNFENCFYFILAEIVKINEKDIILIGSSAGVYWIFIISLYLNSIQFKQKEKLTSYNINKTVLGLISLCGLINFKQKKNLMQNLYVDLNLWTTSILKSPIDICPYLKEISNVPLLMIDSTGNLLSFSNQIDLVETIFSQSEIYLYENKPHNFMFNKDKEGLECKNIVVNFIKNLIGL
jgi:hypothetical protein